MKCSPRTTKYALYAVLMALVFLYLSIFPCSRETAGLAWALSLVVFCAVEMIALGGAGEKNDPVLKEYDTFLYNGRVRTEAAARA